MFQYERKDEGTIPFFYEWYYWPLLDRQIPKRYKNENNHLVRKKVTPTVPSSFFSTDREKRHGQTRTEDLRELKVPLVVRMTVFRHQRCRLTSYLGRLSRLFQRVRGGSRRTKSVEIPPWDFVRGVQ